MQVTDSESLLSAEAVQATAKHHRYRAVAALVTGVALLAIGAAVLGRTSSPTDSPGLLASVQLVAVEETADHKVDDKASKKADKKDDEGKKEKAPKCSNRGENCSATKCCSDPGMQCYGKDAGWSECKVDCMEGPDPSAEDGWPWSCKKLGDRTAGDAVSCSNQGEDCSSSRCCQDPGLTCFEKVNGWATCKVECWSGMDLTDNDMNPWSCTPLGPKAPGIGPWVAKQCAQDSSPCLDKKCCATAGQQCYEQNDFYGECKSEQPKGWSGKTRGPKTPKAALEQWQIPQTLAPWVATNCSKKGHDCRKTGCCSDEGHQCFEKNDTYAACKPTCSPGPDLYDTNGKPWTCNILGPKTPGWASDPWKERKNVSDWVEKECGKEYADDCRTSRCCKKVGNTCFEKNKDWASCAAGCTPGAHEGDTDGNWSCAALGPRTHKPWGSPSLFCFSVTQPWPNPEATLLNSQLGSGYGIFACDEFAVLSLEEFVLGEGPNGPIKSITFVPAEVVESKDHTAGNAELFLHVWDAVKALGKYQSTDWTAKVDPDAVLLPERLRWHLEPHTGESTYIINCAKPYMPEGPMMFGALEAFSRQALDTYFNGVGTCTGSMPWKKYGEDLFMGKCLEMIGVSRSNDFNIYSDGVCRGVDCTDPDAAAFHPKKDPESWAACLQETFNPKPKESTDAPQWFKDYMDTYQR